MPDSKPAKEDSNAKSWGLQAPITSRVTIPFHDTAYFASLPDSARSEVHTYLRAFRSLFPRPPRLFEALGVAAKTLGVSLSTVTRKYYAFRNGAVCRVGGGRKLRFSPGDWRVLVNHAKAPPPTHRQLLRRCRRHWFIVDGKVFTFITGGGAPSSCSN
jgi:hypothetical protein